MGNDNLNIDVEAVEDVLGLSEESKGNKEENSTDAKPSNDDSTDSKDEDKKESEEKNTDNKKDSSKDEAKENSTDNKTKKDENSKKQETVTLTPEQIEINKELVKIDTEIEKLEKVEVDTDEFYSNLDEYLTDEEQQKEFDDKPAYLKLVAAKKKEYVEQNSNKKELTDLKGKKEELERIYQRQEGIVQVTTKYQDFDYEKTMKYFNEELNKKQKDEIFESAQSYADVYEKTYLLMNKTEVKIEKKETPKIPDVNNTRKEAADDSKIKDGFKSEDEDIADALGFR